MIKKIARKLFEKQDLTMEESEFLFERILTGEVQEPELSNILLALRLKGENSDEIAGAVKVLDLFKKRFPKDFETCVDTCGTGGDGKRCFNISTAVAITSCAGGIPVIKHGNSAQSGMMGSADILERLNIPVKMELNKAKKYFKTKKFVFLYAPHFHPAMKHVAPVRKRLNVSTIFNFIGPLVNPADPDFQITGVSNVNKLEILADAVKKAGKDNFVLYSSLDGYDEISSEAPTKCVEINGEIKRYEIKPEEFFKPFKMPAVKDENDAIKMFKKAISGKDENLSKLVALNCAIIFYKMKKLGSLKDGYEYAYEIIKSGKAIEKLNDLVMN